MIIRDEILKEHSKKQATRIAEYACTSKKNFRELIDCFLDEEYRVAQRAAYSVSLASEMKRELIKPHIKTLVAQLHRTDVHNAVTRNSVRILQDIVIPKRYHGEVMNACFGFIEDPKTPGAIKAFSLTTLHKFSSDYPEIKGELKLIIEEKMDNEMPSFRSRARRILKAL